MSAERSRVGASPDPATLDHAAGSELARAALALARRFAEGGTLWCLAPEWPEHGRHLAVEFVHPVIMGKRAIPAVSVTGADAVAELRTATRPGDALVVVGPDPSAITDDVLRRAPAWGVTTVRIGSGERKPDRRADHVVWVDDTDATARHDGRLILRYHVLWELTHVCLEHPGLRDGQDVACEDSVGCITCSDEALPGEVVSVLGAGLATVRVARGVETIDATLIGAVETGDLVLVHAGTAIGRVEPSGG